MCTTSDGLHTCNTCNERHVATQTLLNTNRSQPCIDELQIFDAGGENVALASRAPPPKTSRGPGAVYISPLEIVYSTLGAESTQVVYRFSRGEMYAPPGPDTCSGEASQVPYCILPVFLSFFGRSLPPSLPPSFPPSLPPALPAGTYKKQVLFLARAAKRCKVRKSGHPKNKSSSC